MNKELEQTVIALCKWIQEELKNASGFQTGSIFPAVIEATAKLVSTTRC